MLNELTQTTYKSTYTSSLSKYLSISCSFIPPAVASQEKTGGIPHVVASRSTAKVSGNTLGMFSVKPPPVMCAKAFTFPDFTAFMTADAYILVGVSSSSPKFKSLVGKFI